MKKTLSSIIEILFYVSIFIVLLFRNTYSERLSKSNILSFAIAIGIVIIVSNIMDVLLSQTLSPKVSKIFKHSKFINLAIRFIVLLFLCFIVFKFYSHWSGLPASNSTLILLGFLFTISHLIYCHLCNNF